MSIYKQSGKYVVKVCINGKQILRRKYLGRTILDKDTALACEKDLFIKYSEKQKDYCIDDLFNLFEEYFFKRYKETSATNNLLIFNKHIKKYFVCRNISEITRSYLIYICDSINYLPYKDIHKLVFLTQTFLDFLSSYGLSYSKGLIFVYKSSRLKVKSEKKIYTLEQFLKFYDVLETNEERLMFSLFFYYGLRCGELRGLKVEDFYNDRILIDKEISNKTRFHTQELFDVKTSKSVRYYPYVNNIKELFDIVVKENKLKKKDFVFKSRNKNKKVIGETTIKRLIDKYSFKAKLPYSLTPHEFRHSCVSYLINQGVDVKFVANWIGHSSSRVTEEVYSHILPTKKEEVASAFDYGIDKLKRDKN